MGLLGKWKQTALLKRPVEEIVQEGTFGNGAKEFFIATIITGIISAIITTISIMTSSATTISSITSGITLGITWGGIILIPIIGIIFSAIFLIFVHIIAKLLGGKGSYSNLFGSFLLVAAAINGFYLLMVYLLQLISVIIIILVPNLGIIILGITSLIVFITMVVAGGAGLILDLKVIRKVHEIGTGRAIVAYIVPIIICVIIVIALVTSLILFSLAGVSSGFSESASGISDMQSNAYWMQAEPFAILGGGQSGNTLMLIMRNSSANSLNLTKICAGAICNEEPTKIYVGQSFTKEISGLANCQSDSKFSYNISIDYDTDSDLPMKQVGTTDLVGTCS